MKIDMYHGNIQRKIQKWMYKLCIVFVWTVLLVICLHQSDA